VTLHLPFSHTPSSLSRKMEFAYRIVWVVAFTVNFCVGAINLRKLLDSYLTLKLNNLLEEKRIGHKAELILARETQQDWRELRE